MWNLLKNLLLNPKGPPYKVEPPCKVGPITKTILSASEILAGRRSSDLEEDFAQEHGLLFQAQIIEEIARRIRTLEQQKEI